MNGKICHQYRRRIEKEVEEVDKISEIKENLVPLKQTKVVRVPVKFVSPFILEYEYLGTMPGWSEFAFAQYFKNLVGGVLLFGHTTGSDKAFTKMFKNEKVLQLQRGVNFWWTPKNSASYFISKACRWLKDNTDYNIITATCDEEAGEVGTIYQALNWSYIGAPKHGHPVFLVDGKSIHPKTLYDRHGTSAVGKIKEIYGERVEIVKRTFKHRYAIRLNGKRIESLPYIKRKSRFEAIS